ncbi:MAG: hypothetical protein KAW51_03020 [Candidatus Lokiarchaeota archaeon]|nr:hypothetical protein [Candidatus Lokiarchaeota archaeon]
MKLELISYKKIRADNYIVLFLIINYLVFIFIFSLVALLSIIVYPFAALAIYGFLKIMDGLNKRNNRGFRNNYKILLGFIFIIIALLFLYWMLTRPAITSHIIISLITFPIMIVGFAGIIKGLLIDIYKQKYRILNICIGFITIVICLIVLTFTTYSFIFYIIMLSLTVLFNILSRAALYLSEYGLSLVHIKNFKLFFYIISDYLLYVGKDGNVLTTKFEEDS